jgi:hypothetical protein
MVPAVHAAPPANDDFSNAQVLNGSLPVTATGSNVEATKEVGEHGPWGYFDFEPAGNSVWFSWEAGVSGWVTASTCGSGFNSLLDVYTGSTVFSLQKAAPKREGAHFDCAPGGSQVTFMAVEGIEYKLRVDGNLTALPPPATEGVIALEIAQTPAPSNDNFAAAQTVVAEAFEDETFFRVDVPGFNWNATKEVGEPAHGGNQGGASVWYSWTAPVSGKAGVVARSGAFGTQLGEQDDGLLSVYTGGSLGELTPVGFQELSYFPDIDLEVSAGTTYKIAVDGRFDATAGRPKMGQINFLIYLEKDPPPEPPVASPPPPDTIAPDTTIVKRDVRPGKGRATLTFRSSEAGTFLCKLDGRKQAPCRSPKTYAGLTPGAHTFKVRAVDAAGNADPTPAVARFQALKPKSQTKKSKS